MRRGAWVPGTTLPSGLYKRHGGGPGGIRARRAGPVAVRGVNIEGDDQGDRSVHGGPDKAVYAYAREDTARSRVTLVPNALSISSSAPMSPCP